MLRLVTSTLLLALLAASALADPPGGESQIILHEHICELEAEFVNAFSWVEADPLPPGIAARARASTFAITYDANFPEEARQAFGIAADIWSTHIQSDVPIKVRVRWIAFEQENVLASAGPRLIANFAAAFDPNTWYPTALASALQGVDLNPANPDIEINVNAAFPRWYFGTGTPPPDFFDLRTVALHELGHGLGFTGSMRVIEGLGRWGFSPVGSTLLFPMTYDRFTESDHLGDPIPLLDGSVFPNPSAALRTALTSQRVYFAGPVAISAQIESQLQQNLPVGPGGRPPLYAPSVWNPGSSYSHLTQSPSFYPVGSLNTLMRPRLRATEVILTPGPVTCGMFSDMGWPMGASCAALLPEPPPPLDVPLAITGPCPNPAPRGQTQVVVHLQEQQRVRADLYDVMGRRVRRVFDGSMRASGPIVIDGEPRCFANQPGSIQINASDLASGVYFLRVQTNGSEEVTRITVVH